MKTAISGTRHPLNGEQTAACEFPAFVHPTVADWLTNEYDDFGGVAPGKFYEYVDFGYEGDGTLVLGVHFDSVAARVSDVCTDAGYKRAEFDATGMPLDSIRRLAADEAARLRQMYQD